MMSHYVAHSMDMYRCTLDRYVDHCSIVGQACDARTYLLHLTRSIDSTDTCGTERVFRPKIIWMGFFTFENFASHATDATRRDKAWDRAGKLRLVMRNRTILVAVLISPYFSQKEVGLGVRVSAGSTLGTMRMNYAY